MSVGRICARSVDTADGKESVKVAADRMLARNVGTLVVQDAGGRPVGIITDRDLAVRVVASGRDPLLTTVDEAMTPSPATISEDMPIEAALSLMRSGPYRRLPVVDHYGRLAGIVSLDDVLDLVCEELAIVREVLRMEGPRSLAEMAR